jgi:hypothetical protein
VTTLQDETDTKDLSAWEAAWPYHKRGWAVIPLKPESKEPGVRWQEFQHRRPTDAEIETWFQPDGRVGVGIVTGTVSNLVVLDADSDDAVRWVAERLRESGTRPAKVRTARGEHVYFAAPADEPIPTIRGLIEGLDVKAEGSYVVAPPSVHPHGHAYRWVEGFDPRLDLPPLPDPVLRLIWDRNGKREPVQEGPITEGSRNDTLTRIAGAMRRHGASERSIARALLEENRSRCRPPLPEAEVEKIAASVGRYAPGFHSVPLRDGRGRNRIPERIDAVALHGEPFEPLVSLPLVGQGGFVIEGLSNLIAAYPKVGKTSVVFQGAVLPWLAEGRRVVYLSEEPRRLWQNRVESVEADQLRGLTLVLMAGYDPRDLFEAAFSGEEEVVIMDTVRAALKFEQETDNSELLRRIEPWIVRAREKGRTLVCLHHETKAGGSHGRGIAGGHALFGAFDMAIEIDRVPEADHRRRVRGYGRLTVPPDFLYEERDGRMVSLGAATVVEEGAVRGRVLDALTEEPQRAEEVRDRVSEPRPGLRQIRVALQRLVDLGEAVGSGTGKKGDPRRWWRLEDSEDSIPSSSTPKGTESNPTSQPVQTTIEEAQ